MSLATSRAISIGVAKPKPSAPTSVTAITVVMPTTAPRESTRAPPEDPGEIGASVCTNSYNQSPCGDWRRRLVALMTPTVTVGPPRRLKGEPIAIAVSPARRLSARPRVAGVKEASTSPEGRSTATSVRRSMPTNSTLKTAPSARTI